MDRKIAVYSRKSKFTDKGESIDNQIELCRKYIEVNFGEEACDGICVFEDEGFSGGDTRRPKFKEMMEGVTRGEIGTVVCYRLDRISRNTADFARLIEEFERLDTAFISVKERFDTSSPMGRAMMYISSVFSQLERETIAERIRDNMLELSKTGRWLGGVTPLGYRSKTVETVTEGRRKRHAQLFVEEKEAEAVRFIYDSFLLSQSIEEAAQRVNRADIKTRQGRQYTRFSLKKILTNPVYTEADESIYDYFLSCGAFPCVSREEFDGGAAVMIYNRTIQKKGHASRIRRPEEWIIAKGEHRAIISSGKWIEVQKKINKRGNIRR